MTASNIARSAKGLLLTFIASMPAFAATTGDSAIVPATAPPEESVRDVTSRLNGATYRLTVILPTGYVRTDDCGSRYPTLYLMDGNKMSGLVSFVTQRMVAQGDMTPIITVGVDYPGDSERGLDYAPLPTSSASWTIPPNRGASNFVKVLQEEIVPLVEGAYCTDPTNRGIGGHSLGGLISAYALVHAAGTFNNFWISSPSLMWDNKSIFSDEQRLVAQGGALKARVFSDIGSKELPVMIVDLNHLRDDLTARFRSDLAWEQWVIPGQIHATVPSTAAASALKFLYGTRPSLQLKPAQLSELVGHYQFSTGQEFTLSTDGHKLYGDNLYDPKITKDRVGLSAESPTHFYSRTFGMELVFTTSATGGTHVAITHDGIKDTAARVSKKGPARAPDSRAPGN